MCTSALQERYVNFHADPATLMDRPAALQETVFSRFFEQAQIAALDKDGLSNDKHYPILSLSYPPIEGSSHWTRCQVREGY